MGKTAIARMVALARLADGWEAHECIRPDELWRAHDPERSQVFIADDAFGSTEYRPEAAERWALELDRVLRAMDERHWLIWTSRPAPLKAGLRRIHREHGIEHFPQPAEVQISAAELEVDEKALILFRHAQARSLPPRGVGLVREYGWSIVDHTHFTPERIRRFVSHRLPELSGAEVAKAVAAEIREPTVAMAESLRALGPEHRALLIALLDSPPGPVPERDLAAAVRRHTDEGFPRAPGELVDRLTDHFVRVVPPMSATWVHPSWRDLMIDELAADKDPRRRFLRRSSLEGLLLALSVGGGIAGERRLPLLRDDGDWDAATDRLAELVPALDDADLFRVLSAIAEAAAERGLDDRAAEEVEALAYSVLDGARRRWDRAVTPTAVTLLDAWFTAAARLAAPPEPPEVAATWVELLPTPSIDVGSPAELNALDEWINLVAVLREHAPAELNRFGFPAEHQRTLRTVIERSAAVGTGTAPEQRQRLAAILRRLARLPVIGPAHRKQALGAADVLAPRVSRRDEIEVEAPEPPAPLPERSLVARVLDDL
jgi:hypothetical protein